MSKVDVTSMKPETAFPSCRGELSKRASLLSHAHDKNCSPSLSLSDINPRTVASRQVTFIARTELKRSGFNQKFGNTISDIVVYPDDYLDDAFRFCSQSRQDILPVLFDTVPTVPQPDFMIYFEQSGDSFSSDGERIGAKLDG